MNPTLARRLTAEALGTCLLVATVVGSGIMAERLTQDVALALLGNTLPTGAILVVLITILGPISGAHFNPAVTMVFCMRRDIPVAIAGGYVVAQILGGVLGTVIAHGMFDALLIQVADKARTGPSQWFSEGIATFGLMFAILEAVRFRPDTVPWIVGLYITAAYWFTASTSFANPAVAIARSLTNSFSGIQPADVSAFIMAQLIGAGMAGAMSAWLFRPER